MSPADSVEFAWKHREHFAAVRAHNLSVSIARRRGDWSGQLRNPWEELENNLQLCVDNMPAAV